MQAFVGFRSYDTNEFCPLGCSCSAHLHHWIDGKFQPSCLVKRFLQGVKSSIKVDTYSARFVCFLNNSLFWPGHLMLHILLVFATLSRRYHHPTLSLRTMFRLPVSHFLHWPRPHFLTNHTVLLGHPTRKTTLKNVSRKSCKNSEVFIYPERGHCHLGMKG